MNRIINSPIVITLIVIVAAFTLKSQMKSDFGSEIRGAYDELISIAQDASSDAEKTKAIQDFSEQIAKQLKTGFSMGLSADAKGKAESDEAKFVRVKKLVRVEGVRAVPSQFDSRQSVMFTIKNESEFPLQQVKVNLDYYREGKLIDTSNEWLNEIKVLAVGESINLKKDRNLPNKMSDEEKAAFTADRFEVSVTSFRIVEN